MFFYNTGSPEAGPRPQINIWNWDGTKQYLKHYDQYKFLHFVTVNPRSSEAEKRQARAELTICEKKLEFWRKHPNYDHAAAMKGVDTLNKHWSSGDGLAAA